MTGNTVQADCPSRKLKADLIAKGSLMAGYEILIPGELELKDTPETARQRESWGWRQVLSNVKPKEGITDPPVDYLPYYRFEPEKGWFVYVLNLVDKSTYLGSDLLKGNYEFLEPEKAFGDIVGGFRPRDMIIVNYQTSLINELINLFMKAEEAKRIDLAILNRTLYMNAGEKSKRNEAIRDINLISVPLTVSEIQEAILRWDEARDQWHLEQHQLQVGLNYPEHEGVKNLLKDNEEQVKELARRDSLIERIETFLPDKGEKRFLLEPEQCSSCHESSFDVWKKSRHAEIIGKVTCDVCHQAGEPHLRFEEWFATLYPEQRKEVTDVYPSRLIDYKPDSRKCSECHGTDFDYASSWEKIKHP
jgi:hypothetical protein